jgi:hypothetical protein
MLSVNNIKYSVFGGYSNINLLIDSIYPYYREKFKHINEPFLSIGMDKYFLINVNFSLISLILTLIVYAIYFVRKYWKRVNYMDSRCIKHKN